MLVADVAGCYLDANRAATALLCYTAEELSGMAVANVTIHGTGWTAAEYSRFVHEGTWPRRTRRVDRTEPARDLPALHHPVSLLPGVMMR
jgi:PAS domain-containing protein